MVKVKANSEMKKPALVSIMMPVYNNESSLELALKSIVQQSFTNWECIVVNDGSTDNTAKILDKITDSRFRIVTFEQNQGRPFARQKALELAEGKYLAFLDADDFYHPDKLQKQVEILELYDDVVVVSSGDASYDGNFKLMTYRGVGDGKKRIFVIGQKLRCAMRTSMIRMSVARQFMFDFRLKHAQDTNYMMRLMHNNKYIITPSIHYYYSEFSSVNLAKLLRTYYYSLLNIWSLREYNYSNSVKVVVLIVVKFLATLVLAPLTGVKFFLKRRGQEPTADMIRNFEAALNDLNTKR